MPFIVHVVIFIFGGLVVVAATLFLVVDMFGRVDYLKDKIPGLDRILARRSALVLMLVVTTFLLVGDGLELVEKELPDVSPPVWKFPPPPVPPPIRINPPADKHCWVRNYSTPGNLSWGQAVMTCNSKYDSPFFLTIQYDQKLASTEALLFPGGVTHYEFTLKDDIIDAYVEAPPVKPNEPFTIITHGSIKRAPLVKRVTLKTKDGVTAKFTY
jgi:hypothetical protein